MSNFSWAVQNGKRTYLTASSMVYCFGRQPALPLAVPLGLRVAFRFVNMFR